MRVLIVDDEPLACERLRTILAGEPDIEVVGESRDGISAVAAICKLSPDLVFLDVQMPEMDGFAVLEQLDARHMPVIVFVTAYDQYAIKAFEVAALDYLLKPFDRERFGKALARGRSEYARRNSPDVNARLLSALTEWKQRKQYVERFVVRSGGRVFFLRTDEVDCIEAAGNYVRLHAGKEEYLHRETMVNIEKSLDPAHFARVHRSWIVNVDRVKVLEPMFRGDYIAVLRHGRRVPMSKAYRDRLPQNR
jgi:two-component system LytT family response regulator